MGLGTSRGAAAALAAFIFAGLGQPSMVSAEVFTGGPGDDIEATINTLQPGDELVLSGGMYTLSERFSSCSVRPCSDQAGDLLAMIWVLGMLASRRRRRHVDC